MFGKQIFPKQFGYKLDVTPFVDWKRLAEKIAGSEISQELKEMFAEYEKNGRHGIYGTYYEFTEYYDSASGLTSRFQRIASGDIERTFPTDEFMHCGYMFGSKMGPTVDRVLENKYAVAITEDSIRNNCFDQYIGGLDTIGKKEDWLVIFPLNSIVQFLVELGLRFDDSEDNLIIKWPDHIEKELKDRGFSYEHRLAYEATIFDIEKHDKDFYEKNGKPKISLYGGGDPVFISKEVEYRIKFKMFRPKNNERLGWSD